MNLFVINSNLIKIYAHSKEYSSNVENQLALNDMFEIYLIYGIVDTYSTFILQVKKYNLKWINNFKHKWKILDPSERSFVVFLIKNLYFFLKYNIIADSQLVYYQEKLFTLFEKIRKVAVTLVDSFDWSDANLCKSMSRFILNYLDSRIKLFNQNLKAAV